MRCQWPLSVLFLLQSTSTKPVARPVPPAWSWSSPRERLLLAFFHLDVVRPVTQMWEAYLFIFWL